MPKPHDRFPPNLCETFWGLLVVNHAYNWSRSRSGSRSRLSSKVSQVILGSYLSCTLKFIQISTQLFELHCDCVTKWTWRGAFQKIAQMEKISSANVVVTSNNHLQRLLNVLDNLMPHFTLHLETGRTVCFSKIHIICSTYLQSDQSEKTHPKCDITQGQVSFMCRMRRGILNVL